MSLVNIISTSIYSMKSHKLRIFLTMVGIIVGISSIVTILSIGNGLKEVVSKSAEDTSANKISVYFEPENIYADITLIEPFNKADTYSLRSVEGVEKVQASREFAGINFFTSQITYFDKNVTGLLNSFEGVNLNIKYGRSFNKNENINRLIVLDFEVAKSLFNSPEEAVGHGITINGLNYEVIGVLFQTDTFTLDGTGSSSYLSNNSIEYMNSDTPTSSLEIYLKVGVDKNKAFETIQKELKQSHLDLKGEYKLQDPQEITKAFEKIISGLTTFVTCVTGISLFVGGIGVMNIMYVSVSERKREIGIRRAFGAKPKSILLQFLIEAIFVTGTGGIVGILCGFFFGKIVGLLLPFPPILTVGSFLGATFTSVIVGIVFGMIPAINASRVDPIKAIYK